MSRDQLDDYDSLKQFLLKEFKISPLKLRDRFYALTKQADETYTLLASKLKTTWMYYLQSRGGVGNLEKLISLICADRLKELLPTGCLDFVLAQEKDSWLDYDEVATAADTYMSCHYADGNPKVSYGPKTWPQKQKQPTPRPNGKTGKTADSSTVESVRDKTVKGEAEQSTIAATGLSKPDNHKKGEPPKCFRCNKFGHIAKHRRTLLPESRPTRVTRCAVTNEPVTDVEGEVKSARVAVERDVSTVAPVSQQADVNLCPNVVVDRFRSRCS